MIARLNEPDCASCSCAALFCLAFLSCACAPTRAATAPSTEVFTKSRRESVMSSSPHLKVGSISRDGSEFHAVGSDHARMEKRLLSFSMMLWHVSIQIADCNRRHSAEERTERWWLMSYDRLEVRKSSVSTRGFAESRNNQVYARNLDQ